MLGRVSWSLEFLDSVGISEGVQSMLAGCGTRRNVADHEGTAVSCEGVLEDQGELAASEGGVLLVLIKSSNALFQGKK